MLPTKFWEKSELPSSSLVRDTAQNIRAWLHKQAEDTALREFDSGVEFCKREEQPSSPKLLSARFFLLSAALKRRTTFLKLTLTCKLMIQSFEHARACPLPGQLSKPVFQVSTSATQRHQWHQWLACETGENVVRSFCVLPFLLYSASQRVRTS